MNRMERKKAEKQKNIIDAAEKIVAEKGMSGMTMEQVAITSDVATGTLYRYFKNKGSLLAAVNARINRELNDYIKNKTDLYDTGIEKLEAMADGSIEFIMNDRQKWNAITELYQMKVENPDDPHVKEFLEITNEMIQMMAEAYRLGIQEGTIREDLDPVATAVYHRMVFANVSTPTTEQKMLLEYNKISYERYLSVTGDLISRSTKRIIPKD